MIIGTRRAEHTKDWSRGSRCWKASWRSRRSASDKLTRWSSSFSGQRVAR